MRSLKSNQALFPPAVDSTTFAVVAPIVARLLLTLVPGPNSVRPVPHLTRGTAVLARTGEVHWGDERQRN